MIETIRKYTCTICGKEHLFGPGDHEETGPEVVGWRMLAIRLQAETARRHADLDWEEEVLLCPLCVRELQSPSVRSLNGTSPEDQITQVLHRMIKDAVGAAEMIRLMAAVPAEANHQ